jgi:hypothetical protein
VIDMPKRKEQWSEGDLFAVPLMDGTAAVGQILHLTPQALNSAVCAYYGVRVWDGITPEKALGDDKLIAVLFTTRDLLDSGKWRVVDRAAPRHLDQLSALRELECNGFVGAKIIGSGIITKLLEAYFGLRPWDAFADPLYLDKLLVAPDRRPSNVVFRSRGGREPER